MNTILLVIAGILLACIILILISPILSAISLLLMVPGLFAGDGYFAIGGMIGVILFSRFSMLAQSKPTYIVNK